MNANSAKVPAAAGAAEMDDPRKDRARLACFVHLLLQHLRTCRASHLLVMLTMAIGSMGMAATFFIGDGALIQLRRDMEQLMGSQIAILPDPGPNGALLKTRSAVAFTDADLEALRGRVPAARHIVPHQFSRTTVVANGIETAIMVEGISPELEGDAAFRPVAGREFSAAAREGLSFECLITKSVVARLHLAVGDSVSVAGRLFTVAGVVPDPPLADSRFQIRIVMPFRTAWLMFGQPGLYDGFVAVWDRPDHLERLLDQLKETLDDVVGPDCYSLSSSRIAAQKWKNVVANVMAFGTAQAFFCVLVASIGVANVMLANVVRRRREYAIRIAMGARQSEIFGLVLCESMLIGFAGGLAGIAAGMAISPLVCRELAGRIHEVQRLAPVFSLRGILIPLAACGISGLLAGVVPALQIRRMDVLSVLHAE